MVQNNILIGGMFGLPEIQMNNKGVPPFFSGENLLVVNARSAIHILVNEINPSKIWLPSYLCDVVFDSLDNYEYGFYEVDASFETSTDWIKDVRPNDIVIIIDYFGFPFHPRLAKRIRKSGAWILEDASQALLSEQVGEFSDFVVYSPRKFLGVPDGGILRNNTNLDFSKIRLRRPPQAWWLEAFLATMLRYEFDHYGGNRKWFNLFQETDRDGPVGYFSMSDLSNALLRYGFDYNEIARKRVENYNILQYHLCDFALFPKLLDGVVPIGFPIRLRNRDSVRQKLFDCNIYPPVHWPIKGAIPDIFSQSHQLADTILTVVCDQRYDSEDMEKTAKIILSEGRKYD